LSPHGRLHCDTDPTNIPLHAKMAYLLEFPPSTLPDDIRAPPYVIFGIRGQSIVEILPRRVPLNAILHFAPKIAQWMLSAPENLPSEVAQGVQHTPFIGIDIQLDIGPASFQRIISKILQSAGLSVPKHSFQHPPSLITSISIRKTWFLFELPRAGLDGLHIHMQTRLMMGAPVTFVEMQELWAEFPADSAMLRVMAINFVQSHIALHYSRHEFSAVRNWYLSTKERYGVFKAAEDQFPEYGKRLAFNPGEIVVVNKNASESRRRAGEQDEAAADEAAVQQAMSRRMEMLERRKAIKDSRKLSMNDMLGERTTRKSLKWKSAPDLRDGALSDALRKVQLEREAESVSLGREETLQPTVYEPPSDTN
jgi:hypothetical protein